MLRARSAEVRPTDAVTLHGAELLPAHRKDATVQAPPYPAPTTAQAPPPAFVPPPSAAPYLSPAPPPMPTVLPVLLPAVPPPRLVPRSTAEIIDEGVRAVRRDIGLFAAIAAFTVVPANLLTALATALFTPFNVFDPRTYFRVGDVAAVTANSEATLLITIVIGFVSFAVNALGMAALITAAGLRTLGQPCDVGSAYRHASRRYWAVVGTQVLGLLVAGAIASFSFGLASPVALWLYVSWQIAPHVAVLEGKGPVAALKRSREITTGGWWRLAWILVILGALGAFFAAVPSGLAQLIGSFTLSKDLLGGRTGAVVLAILATLVNIVLLPITAAVTTLFFTDGRVRREGFDVDVLLQRGAAVRERKS